MQKQISIAEKDLIIQNDILDKGSLIVFFVVEIFDVAERDRKQLGHLLCHLVLALNEYDIFVLLTYTHISVGIALEYHKIGRERKMYKLPAMAFELDGLDKTNSNARSRAILLHKSFGPMSLGCVTVPLVRYNKVAELLHSQSGGVILWAYK